MTLTNAFSSVTTMLRSLLFFPFLSNAVFVWLVLQQPDFTGPYCKSLISFLHVVGGSLSQESTDDACYLRLRRD